MTQVRELKALQKNHRTSLTEVGNNFKYYSSQFKRALIGWAKGSLSAVEDSDTGWQIGFKTSQMEYHNFCDDWKHEETNSPSVLHVEYVHLSLVVYNRKCWRWGLIMTTHLIIIACKVRELSDAGGAEWDEMKGGRGGLATAISSFESNHTH